MSNSKQYSQSYGGYAIGSTGLFEMIIGVLTTCHTQCTSDRIICIFYLI